MRSALKFVTTDHVDKILDVAFGRRFAAAVKAAHKDAHGDAANVNCASEETAMATLNLNKAEFLKSAVSPSGFLAADLPCIVFAGKSNVGKSSVINRLLNRKNFARVGSQPGKTVHVNYFCIDGRAYFVDLPGYGYASVAKAERDALGQAHGGFLLPIRRASRSAS